MFGLYRCRSDRRALDGGVPTRPGLTTSLAECKVPPRASTNKAKPVSTARHKLEEGEALEPQVGGIATYVLLGGF
jgi:hypothetical protein